MSLLTEDELVNRAQAYGRGTLELAQRLVGFGDRVSSAMSGLTREQQSALWLELADRYFVEADMWEEAGRPSLGRYCRTEEARYRLKARMSPGTPMGILE